MATDKADFNAKTLEDLLAMEESEVVDFKREQYPFEEASDTDKSELLKDILAFTNAQRHRTAYILIGIAEVQAGHHVVVGVEAHLDDADLHQFVNSKTNRPIAFSYFPFPVEDKDIGVLRIPLQTRPVYVTRNFGKVNRDVVYVRDGSSTRPASPDQIVLMGRGTPPQWAVDRLEALAKGAILTAVQHWHENPSRLVNYDERIREDVTFNALAYGEARAFVLGRSRSIEDYETGIDSYGSLYWVFQRFETLASYCGQMFRTIGSSLVEYGALIRAMLNLEGYVEHEGRAWENYRIRIGNPRSAIPREASFNLLVAAELSVRLVDVINSENFEGDADYEHRRDFAPEVRWESPEWQA